MTTALASPAHPGHLSPVARLHACLDNLALLDVSVLGVDEHSEFLREVSRAESRIAGLKLRALAAADRARTGRASGAASTGQWAAGLGNTDQVTAHRQVGLATGLAERAVTEQALSSGAITPDHAAVIVQADRNLPASVTREQRATVESALVAKARTMAPGALRRVARRALEEIEHDAALIDAQENEIVRSEEELARTKTRLSLHENSDGTVTGHFTVPSAQGQLLRKILETITAPRRGRLGASPAQVGDREARTDWDRARGEAFCELIEHLPTDHLHPKTAATLVVTIAEDALREALRVAGLDTGGALSAGEARRLACSSSIYSAVLGGTSLPLDLGRSSRLFSEPQRTALGLVHTTCAADGCERPFAWCELHHRKPWSTGGKTDLEDAVPLCHFHHQRIHDDHFQHHRRSDGSIRFHQRT